jgi:hypothetical protein
MSDEYDYDHLNVLITLYKSKVEQVETVTSTLQLTLAPNKRDYRD